MLYNVSVYNKESSYIYGSNYFLTITKICYAQTHMRGKASHPSFLFYINILSPLPYQAFVILQASLPLLYPLTCHNRCLILMFSNVAWQPSSTFSPFSPYPLLVLMFHYYYITFSVETPMSRLCSPSLTTLISLYLPIHIFWLHNVIVIANSSTLQQSNSLIVHPILTTIPSPATSF